MNDEKVHLSRRQFLIDGMTLGAGLLFVPTFLTHCSPTTTKILEAPLEQATRIFNVTAFTAAPDGRKREIRAYNGQFPGPVIRVKQGDTIKVKVENKLGVPTTIHWHGMKQKGTWQMDGVADVTQKPFPSGSSFTYQFKADPAGTHWYHSHQGVQYSDGLIGPIVIETKVNPYSYDREEVLMIHDWFLEQSEQIYKDLVAGTLEGKSASPMKMIPGSVKKDVGDVPFQSFLFNGKGRRPGKSGPLTTFTVRKGERIRFRIINGSSTYAFRLQFDGHPVTVIEADGHPITPVVVDNLDVAIGERFDLILHATGSGAQWIRAVTLDGNQGVALLKYNKDQAEPPMTPVKWGQRTLKVLDIRAPNPVNLGTDKPREFTLVAGGTMSPYAWNINGKQFPKAGPIEVQKGETIRFIMKNPTGMDHPFHIHGHYFRILGKPGALNLKDPPLKDTITVPSKGEVVTQWHANNPGKWFFHCHIEWHLMSGMARVIKYKSIKEPDLWV